jgi:hypothetical protein
MFNVESTKDCMSIFLFSNLAFHMWEMVFVEWENCNILYKTRDVSTCLLAPTEKSACAYLSNLKREEIGKVGSRFSC